MDWPGIEFRIPENLPAPATALRIWFLNYHLEITQNGLHKFDYVVSATPDDDYGIVRFSKVIGGPVPFGFDQTTWGKRPNITFFEQGVGAYEFLYLSDLQRFYLTGFEEAESYSISIETRRNETGDVIALEVFTDEMTSERMIGVQDAFLAGELFDALPLVPAVRTDANEFGILTAAEARKFNAHLFEFAGPSISPPNVAENYAISVYGHAFRELSPQGGDGAGAFAGGHATARKCTVYKCGSHSLRTHTIPGLTEPGPIQGLFIAPADVFVPPLVGPYPYGEVIKCENIRMDASGIYEIPAPAELYAIELRLDKAC